MQGHPFGSHRSIEPQNVLPQPAWKLDTRLPLYDNELLIDVEALNVDSASFKQLKEEAQGDESQLKQNVMNLIQTRGKLHNPVTGSGGMLIGKVQERGASYPHRWDIGDRVASLVSLTLTPLHIDEIVDMNLRTGQIHVRGYAILFESSPLAKLPSDLLDPLSLALLDVCGAPAQVERLVQTGDTVLVLGAGGKSGLLSTYQAQKSAGRTGKVLALEYDSAQVETVQKLGIADTVWQGDARDSLQVYEKVVDETAERLADVVINCVNVDQTEMSSILCTKDGGTAYFFSMATSFTAAALGAEGVGKDIKLMMGNGYASGHAELTLELIREHPQMKQVLLETYAPSAFNRETTD
ncbi:L-erythro-3,5-diaminohexanoate dehydrogenase [Caldalkalibacillus salinus]|uniref:L-erythro-3,5-diaminohexanoate dehydrogenase n=1 Tax=Caldalkalibacillus salinus TaxID=2803787 RepID=UPI001921559C|nr:L-erythro-3,5-diaminohexanoate dehydrogenase [Caldalkalibacillus salinus]